MKIFKSEGFSGLNTLKKLNEFVNNHNIKKEDIVTITQDGFSFVIFYYAEED